MSNLSDANVSTVLYRGQVLHFFTGCGGSDESVTHAVVHARSHSWGNKLQPDIKVLKLTSSVSLHDNNHLHLHSKPLLSLQWFCVYRLHYALSCNIYLPCSSVQHRLSVSFVFYFNLSRSLINIQLVKQPVGRLLWLHPSCQSPIHAHTDGRHIPCLLPFLTDVTDDLIAASFDKVNACAKIKIGTISKDV